LLFLSREWNDLQVSRRPSLFAVSDLHVAFQENRDVVADVLRSSSPEDWLVVAGDVGELVSDVRWALQLLSERFAQVIWAPGNHELWTPPDDPNQLRGLQRYEYLVGMCRGLGVLTPEDPYARWSGPGGPVTVAPLFVLYDYSFLAPGATTKGESLAYAYRTGVVCSDEFLLDPQPYASLDEWCSERVRITRARLRECGKDTRLVLVNHFPLVREPTRILRHPEFAQWCGTQHTVDWHRRFPVEAVVYGHLHIPRTMWHDGVRFEEVSLGYPREWQRRPRKWSPMRRILPLEDRP
jgi:3',5'-cyclic AMP phosphodiesterase CpdA